MTKKTIENENRETIGWFDLDKANTIEEGSWFDGSNQISQATGSQWDHQMLYYSAKGKWILHNWSQQQGTRKTYQIIDEQEAHDWILKNEISPAEMEWASDALKTRLEKLSNQAEM